MLNLKRGTLLSCSIWIGSVIRIVKPCSLLQACKKRIEGDESGHKHCTGQYFDYLSCIDKCVRLLYIIYEFIKIALGQQLNSALWFAGCTKAVRKTEVIKGLRGLSHLFSFYSWHCQLYMAKCFIGSFWTHKLYLFWLLVLFRRAFSSELKLFDLE